MNKESILQPYGIGHITRLELEEDRPYFCMYSELTKEFEYYEAIRLEGHEALDTFDPDAGTKPFEISAERLGVLSSQPDITAESIYASQLVVATVSIKSWWEEASMHVMAAAARGEHHTWLFTGYTEDRALECMEYLTGLGFRCSEYGTVDTIPKTNGLDAYRILVFWGTPEIEALEEMKHLVANLPSSDPPEPISCAACGDAIEGDPVFAAVSPEGLEALKFEADDRRTIGAIWTRIHVVVSEVVALNGADAAPYLGDLTDDVIREALRTYELLYPYNSVMETANALAGGWRPGPDGGSYLEKPYAHQHE